MNAEKNLEFISPTSYNCLLLLTLLIRMLVSNDVLETVCLERRDNSIEKDLCCAFIAMRWFS